MFKKNKIASKALRLMEKTSKNVYLTGEAGTGKSTLLREFISSTSKKVAILAPTGLAAINVGGETIHSFCKFSLDPAFKIIQDNKIHRLKSRKKIKALDTIIIDEISMVRADTLDAMNIFFQKNIGNKKPFGGLQLIMIGDHFQLPPILRRDEKAEYQKEYFCEYFFAAKVFDDLKLNFFKLTQIYRQEDSQYIKLLSYLRYGVSNPSLIQWINTHLVSKPIQNKSLPVTIATRNLDVTKLNHTKLESLEGEVESYKAIIEGDFKKETFPTDKYLVLKENAQVMFIKNDLERNWVNGTIGKIHSLHRDYIVVRLPSGKKIKVMEETWEINKYQFNEEEQKLEKIVIGSFTQYPIKLAWAVTIHKSQGQTFQSCIIDMGAGAFVYGQTYVAFSRCTSLEGLSLRKPIRASDIKADPHIIEFDKTTKWINK